MENQAYWGYHLMFSAINLDEQLVQDQKYIKQFSTALVKAIDMVPLTRPITKYCNTSERDKAGITLYQIIETSNISAHFLDDGRCLFDVFSCKPYDYTIVLKLFTSWFSKPNSFAKIIHQEFISRPA
jgi:S-adenosylmethionine/arginine decarboxylase-like enzyme